MQPYITLENLNCYGNPYEIPACQPVSQPVCQPVVPQMCQAPPPAQVCQPILYPTYNDCQPYLCEQRVQMNYQWTPSQVYNIRWPQRYY